MNTRLDELIANARSYVGQQEVRGNMGFKDPKFEAEMKEEGWRVTWAWCAIFAKVVFKNVYPDKAAELNKLFSPSTVTTFNNFKKAGYSISDKPFAGALIIWQTYKKGVPQTTGHAGICLSANGDQYESIEGNTTVDPEEREGYIVAIKKRVARSAKVVNGLNVMGFIRVA